MRLDQNTHTRARALPPTPAQVVTRIDDETACRVATMHAGDDGGADEWSTTTFGVRFAPNSREVLGGCRNGRFVLYDVERGAAIAANARAHTDDINAVCFVGASSNVFCTAADDSLCKVCIHRISAAILVASFSLLFFT